jgi:hypothetical protein
MFRADLTLLPHLLRRLESAVVLVMLAIDVVYFSSEPRTCFANDQCISVLGVPPPFAVDGFAPGPGYKTRLKRGLSMMAERSAERSVHQQKNFEAIVLVKLHSGHSSP